MRSQGRTAATGPTSPTARWAGELEPLKGSHRDPGGKDTPTFLVETLSHACPKLK